MAQVFVRRTSASISSFVSTNFNVDDDDDDDGDLLPGSAPPAAGRWWSSSIDRTMSVSLTFI